MRAGHTLEIRLSLVRLLTSLSLSLDFAREGLLQHHRRVSLIALRLAEGVGLPAEERQKLFMAAMVHDAGAPTFKEKATLSKFDVHDTWPHSWRGAELVRRAALLAPVADLVRGHHDRWDGNNATGWTGAQIPLGCRIIHLADRVDVLLHHEANLLAAREKIFRRLKAAAGTVFDPDLVDLLTAVAAPESFWLDLTSPFLEETLADAAGSFDVAVGLEELAGLAEFYAAVIDAKSPFTHRHSQRVAGVAATLAGSLGFSAREQQLLRLAGLLHDLGKVSVPEEILDKPGSLTEAEFNVIKQHTYYTYHLLGLAGDLSPVKEWAAYHHEKLDGSGYPFRLKAPHLDLGARVVAVADVFTALREERPYRPGLAREEVCAILRRQAAAGALDRDVVETAVTGYEELEAALAAAGAVAGGPAVA